MGKEVKDSALTPEVNETPETPDVPTEAGTVENEGGEGSASGGETDFAAKKPEEEKKDSKEEDSKEDGESEDSDKKKKDEEEDYAKKKSCKNSLVEQDYSELKQKYDTLNTQYSELLAFKQKIEDKEKDGLIEKFFMLSDEDKKDVVENKAKYSLEEIESRLSVICFRKKVNFDLSETSENDNKTETQNITTYSLNDDSSTTPAWIKRVKDTKVSNNC